MPCQDDTTYEFPFAFGITIFIASRHCESNESNRRHSLNKATQHGAKMRASLEFSLRIPLRPGAFPDLCSPARTSCTEIGCISLSFGAPWFHAAWKFGASLGMKLLALNKAAKCSISAKELSGREDEVQRDNHSCVMSTFVRRISCMRC